MWNLNWSRSGWKQRYPPIRRGSGRFYIMPGSEWEVEPVQRDRAGSLAAAIDHMVLAWVALCAFKSGSHLLNKTVPWDPSQNTSDCRVFEQQINSDNMCEVIQPSLTMSIANIRGSEVLQTHSFRPWSLVLWASSDKARRKVEGGGGGVGGKAAVVNLFQQTS